ncbi:aromatase/cyclase [Micromonospora zhanjiangensis]|uniref:Aromatase/cyclase n=1 Tax=Micromonospora zhanjiangensis TaxID=1522057 RepID=A0ABV8KVP0_9ACTN
MSSDNTHTTEHEVVVAAAADVIYGLVERVTAWPLIFPPTLRVEILEQDGPHERLRLCATANGQVKTWTSRRLRDRHAHRIEFRQEVSAPPVAAMGGSWLLEPLGLDRTRVRLLHDFRAIDDDPEQVRWIEEAVARNSEAELAALRKAAESPGGGITALTETFADTVHVNGTAADAYAFIRDADRWAERLPHVARVRLTEETPDVQVLEMDTRTKDGALHTTRSVRLCESDRTIIYKQSVLPALLRAHLGRWTFEQQDGGVAVTSAHSIVIEPGAVATVLGDGATVEDAKSFVRSALSGNSMATLELAKAFAERSGAARVGR